MKMDLSPIFGGETDELSLDYPLTIGEEFAGVTFPKPARVLGTITNKAGYIALKATITLSYETLCDRCLRPISKELTLDYEKGIALSGTLETEDQDEYLIAREKMLELDEPLTEAVILEFPMKNLCREDCKGLCPVCGCDLNLMQCSCSRTVKNANFASLEELAQLLNNEEEV